MSKSFTAFTCDQSSHIIDLGEDGSVETFQMCDVEYLRTRTGYVAADAILHLQDFYE